MNDQAQLLDGHKRRIDYLRLSVTDRCDLRCGYCMPRGHRNFIAPADLLSFEEIERVVRVLAGLGVARVRLTGGEPLLRRDLAGLATRISAISGIADLSLSTNGTLLARHARPLRRAGISRLNVSLDSVRPERVREITGRDVLSEVIAGLMAARNEGFSPIKINMVPLGGRIDDEIDAMAEFCMRHGFVLRLIEVMPVGQAAWCSAPPDMGPVRERLKLRYGLIDGVIAGGGPARYLVSPDGRFSVGFITPLSQHFCATCNRVRLGADGTLHLCLGQEDRFDLRARMRGGACDDEIARSVLAAVRTKPERHDFQGGSRRIIRVMAATGG